MIIKLFFAAAFLMTSLSASAKGHATISSEPTKKTSLSASAKGPTGIGALKIGMSKEAVDALISNDGVYLSAPMTPYEYKNSSPIPNEDRFNALLISMISAKPLEAVLTFSGNALKSIFVTLETSSSMLEEVKGQISSKYGEPKVENSMKEEQCIYKNGANFKISTGDISYKWLLSQPKGEKIETSLSELVYETCPSNLRYSSIGAIKIQTLSIRIANDKLDNKAANPF